MDDANVPVRCPISFHAKFVDPYKQFNGSHSSRSHTSASSTRRTPHTSQRARSSSGGATRTLPRGRTSVGLGAHPPPSFLLYSEIDCKSHSGPHADAWNPWPMSQIAAIYGTDDDDEIMQRLYLIANVRFSFPALEVHAGLIAFEHRTPRVWA